MTRLALSPSSRSCEQRWVTFGAPARSSAHIRSGPSLPRTMMLVSSSIEPRLSSRAAQGSGGCKGKLGGATRGATAARACVNMKDAPGRKNGRTRLVRDSWRGGRSNRSHINSISVVGGLYMIVVGLFASQQQGASRQHADLPAARDQRGGVELSHDRGTSDVIADAQTGAIVDLRIGGP